MRALHALPLLLLVACRPSPPAPPTPDASDAAVSLCAAACANLADLGCPEGTAANCVAVCERAKPPLVDLHPACLAEATSRAAVRACGPSVACP